MALFTLKKVNAELTQRGHNARLEKGSGYFYFKGGEATAWIDRTVPVSTVNSLTLDQWMEEFALSKKLNADLMRTASRDGKTAR
jgi:hypothetical protein